jgi:hypothetical protein
MNKGPIATTVSLLLSVMLLMPPLAVSAGRAGAGHMGGVSHASFGGHVRFGGHVGGPRAFGGVHPSHRGFGSHHAFHHHFSHPFFGHRFGPFFPFGAFASPVAFWGWPGSYGWPYFAESAISPAPPDYYAQPAVYPPPMASSPAMAPTGGAPPVYSVNIYNPAPAAAQPAVQPSVYEPPAASMPSAVTLGAQGVVEYDGGRYELRGDGMATPYRWVWIPNPPPGPPGSPAMRAPASGELAPARRGTVYHWVDDEGVVHMTDRWLTVPQRYREQAKQNLGS